MTSLKGDGRVVRIGDRYIKGDLVVEITAIDGPRTSPRWPFMGKVVSTKDGIPFKPEGFKSLLMGLCREDLEEMVGGAS